MINKFLNKLFTSDTRAYIRGELYWETSKIIKVVEGKLRIIDPVSSNRMAGEETTFSFCSDVDSFVERFLVEEE